METRIAIVTVIAIVATVIAAIAVTIRLIKMIQKRTIPIGKDLPKLTLEIEEKDDDFAVLCEIARNASSVMIQSLGEGTLFQSNAALDRKNTHSGELIRDAYGRVRKSE